MRPNLDETCGRDVGVLVANPLRLAKRRGQQQVIFAELDQHVAQGVVGIVAWPRSEARVVARAR